MGTTGRIHGVVSFGLDVGTTLAPLAFGALLDAGRCRGAWLGIAGMRALLIGTVLNVRQSAAPAVASGTA